MESESKITQKKSKKYFYMLLFLLGIVLAGAFIYFKHIALPGLGINSNEIDAIPALDFEEYNQ